MGPIVPLRKQGPRVASDDVLGLLLLAVPCVALGSRLRGSTAWAIDGNTDGAFGANTTWHDRDGDAAGTGVEDPDVFTVNFAGPRTVDSFEFWGRTDCCPERDDNFRVEFYNGTALTGVNSPVSIGGAFTSGRVDITIPEPASAAFIALIGLAGIFRRRRH